MMLVTLSFFDMEMVATTTTTLLYLCLLYSLFSYHSRLLCESCRTDHTTTPGVDFRGFSPGALSRCGWHWRSLCALGKSIRVVLNPHLIYLILLVNCVRSTASSTTAVPRRRRYSNSAHKIVKIELWFLLFFLFYVFLFLTPNTRS